MAGKHNELIVKEGWPFLIPFVLITLICIFFKANLVVTIFFAAITLFIANFFRNPYRKIPEDPQAIISPGDGKVVAVHKLEDGRQLISIFLNVFNVHVNRCPIGGEVESVNHINGQFLAAYHQDASKLNERNAMVIRDGDFSLEVVQIAGLIARRIICWSQKGDQVAKGERYGLIRFGSRMDVIMPETCEILVKTGQKVRGGSDILATRPL